MRSGRVWLSGVSCGPHHSTVFIQYGCLFVCETTVQRMTLAQDYKGQLVQIEAHLSSFIASSQERSLFVALTFITFFTQKV